MMVCTEKSPARIQASESRCLILHIRNVTERKRQNRTYNERRKGGGNSVYTEREAKNMKKVKDYKPNSKSENLGQNGDN